METKSLLQIFLGEFREKLNHLGSLVPREAHFPEAKGKIKVAIGMRRSGKTYFLFQKILSLLESTSFSNILYLNFEDDRLLPLDEKKLAALVDAFYALYPENHDERCYLCFDEIQNVPNWPLVVRRLHDSKNVEIFLTGSSAKLLSKEIATSLRGRSLAVEIWPYSFNEFLVAKELKIDRSLYDKKAQDFLHHAFESYLSEGGFPEIVSYQPDVKQQTLQEYLDVVVYRDVIERHNIKNPSLVKYMIFSMIHNVGKPYSVNKLYNDLKTQGYPVGKDALYDYANHLEDAYLAFQVPAFDASIRKRQAKPKKLYAIDPGMVRALTLDYEKDLGRLFENIVFLDLKRRGYQVFHYQTKDGFEVDFLAQTPKGEKKLFQVAWDTYHEATLEREQRALDAVHQETGMQGELITLDRYLSQDFSF